MGWSTNQGCSLKWGNLGILQILWHDTCHSISDPRPEPTLLLVTWISLKVHVDMVTIMPLTLPQQCIGVSAPESRLISISTSTSDIHRHVIINLRSLRQSSPSIPTCALPFKIIHGDLGILDITLLGGGSCDTALVFCHRSHIPALLRPDIQVSRSKARSSNMVVWSSTF